MLYLINGIIGLCLIIYVLIDRYDVYIDCLKFRYFNDSKYDAFMTIFTWIHIIVIMACLIIGINKI